MEGYKSGKQRRAEIKAARRVHRMAARVASRVVVLPPGRVVPVDYSRLMANNHDGLSAFALRGYYIDRPFSCQDCGAPCVWSAEQQRWWYETIGGSPHAIAKRCRPRRQRERQRKELARQVSQAGRLEKQARLVAAAR
ncbi:MAG TPA: zinc-ribbon domain containing protein [Accumulibacter sp.]|nr:zinc-ribbon domain containing protein [Accumulibacter sp.]HNE14196.1 zinc-ribbon domain containing protein [Accumulibacter sp.]HNI73595.1 zinc-ribbon domain containing protein [Accumulibacter sp.]HNL78429.1 zinc-ribbon domain containing protein [Accumulibacter sp.]HNO58610.1 zinc-ribbon domain containing protein [Accumulibacter sp.]